MRRIADGADDGEGNAPVAGEIRREMRFHIDGAGPGAVA